MWWEFDARPKIVSAVHPGRQMPQPDFSPAYLYAQTDDLTVALVWWQEPVG
jgi:hypothetical protein